MIFQVCKKCNIKKSLPEFYKNPECKLGVVGVCKECTRIRCRNNYQKNKEVRLKQIAKWKKENTMFHNSIRRKHWSAYKSKINNNRRKKNDELNDSYVKHLLKSQCKGNIKTFDPQSIETKRLLIQIKREINKTPCIMERNLDFEVDTHEDLNKMLTGVLMDVRRGSLDHSMVKSITLVADKINKNVMNANEYKKISNHNKPIKFFQKDYDKINKNPKQS